MCKVRRDLIVVFLLMISFTFYGCNNSKQNNNGQDKLHTMLTALKNYEADVTITFFKDTQKNVIKMKQAVEIGGKYKLTVDSPAYLKGYTTKFDGETILEYNPNTKMNAACKPNEARNQTLLSSFIHNYLNTQEVKKDKGTLNDKEVIIFEVDVPGNYKYMVKEKVWFDKNTLSPIKMEIYDVEGNRAIEVEFSNFKHNTQMKL